MLVTNVRCRSVSSNLQDRKSEQRGENLSFFKVVVTRKMKMRRDDIAFDDFAQQYQQQRL